MIKYSIIIPIYGCEKYLEPCVQSVLNQKGNYSYEIILIDDGSKDRSGEIADKFAEQYEQIRTVHKENGGAASARNRGIQEAKGEYILFVDGDDTIENDTLEIADNFLKNSDCDLIIFGMLFDFYKNEKLIETQIHSYDESCALNRSEALNRILELFNSNSLSSSCAKVFSSGIINDNSIRFNENLYLYEDFDFVLRYIGHIGSINVINKETYHYRLDIEDNRYRKRVADGSRFNYLLQCIHSDFDKLLYSEDANLDLIKKQMISIEQSMLNHALSESLNKSLNNYVMFCRVSEEYRNYTEFQRIYISSVEYVLQKSKVIDLTHNKKYFRMWIWVYYRKVRSKIVNIIRKVVRKL